MNSWERTKSVLDKRIPDRLPKEIKLTPPVEAEFRKRTGSTDPTTYFNLDVQEVFFGPPERMPDFSKYYPLGMPRLENNRGWEVGEWGVGQTLGSLHHFIHIEHPMKDLTSLDDLKKYPFPNMSEPNRHRHLEQDVKSLHEKGFFVVGYMEWTIFEIAWHMRGMEQLFLDMYSNPQFAEYLLNRITEIRCFQAGRFAEAGVDIIRVGDDVGTQISMLLSPEMYRKWFKPRHAAVIRSAKQVAPDINIQYHSDGNCFDIIPDLIEIGVTVLNPLQPECLDLAQVKREFGQDLCFWGGIGTQTTMPFSTAWEVYDTVHRTIDILGPKGYVPCPTHVLEPDVPWENIEAYLRAVDEYKFC